MVSLLGLFGLLWLSLRTIVGRVFAVPYPGSQMGMLTLVPPSEDSQDLQHVLILGPPGSGKSRIPQDMKVDHGVIDCREIVNESEWNIEKQKGISGGNSIFIDNFEFRLGHPKYDSHKGELIKTATETIEVDLYSFNHQSRQRALVKQRVVTELRFNWYNAGIVYRIRLGEFVTWLFPTVLQERNVGVNSSIL